MLKKSFILAAMGFSLLAFSVQARPVIKYIGDTNYMIREAHDAGAAYEASQDYQQALQLQKQAKEAFDKRNLTQAKQLTQQAFDHAKSARDQSLTDGRQIERFTTRPKGRVIRPE